MSFDQEKQRFLKEAMSWVGTKYVDMGEAKGAGADCAGYVKGALTQAELIEEFDKGYYSPQQWLNRHFEDTTYLNTVLSIAYEIPESEVQPADIVLYRFVQSWTHGAIVVKWPSFVLHSIKPHGVCGANGTTGMLRRPRRFFRLCRWKEPK